MSRISRQFMGLLGSALIAALGTHASANEAVQVTSALDRPAIEVRNPQGAFMIDAAMAGSTVVAVGERGLVLLSDDQGASWRQAEVPISTSLTAVQFVDEQNGMAVGHGGVVLGTKDGGESWTLKLDGRKAAELALEDARDRGDERAIRDARRLINDGPDKPFLDVLMLSQRRAIVAGAYGLVFRTVDGGESWESIISSMDNPDLLHFYAMGKRGSRIVAVGERGLVNISDDNGVTFEAAGTPYNGSFFTVELPTGKEIVAAGLKGNIWRSGNSGRSWEPLPSDIDASITSSRLLPAGGILFGNQAGMLMRMNGSILTPITNDRLSPINAFVRAGDQLIVLTVEGIRLAGSGNQ